MYGCSNKTDVHWATVGDDLNNIDEFLSLSTQEKEIHVFSRMCAVFLNVISRDACSRDIQNNVLCPKTISCSIDALLSY